MRLRDEIAAHRHRGLSNVAWRVARGGAAAPFVLGCVLRLRAPWAAGALPGAHLYRTPSAGVVCPRVRGLYNWSVGWFVNTLPYRWSAVPIDLHSVLKLLWQVGAGVISYRHPLATHPPHPPHTQAPPATFTP